LTVFEKYGLFEACEESTKVGWTHGENGVG